MEYTVEFVDLPPRVKGFVTQTFDDGEDYYTIMINATLNREQQIKAFMHEIEHINNNDFDKDNVQEIESR